MALQKAYTFLSSINVTLTSFKKNWQDEKARKHDTRCEIFPRYFLCQVLESVDVNRNIIGEIGFPSYSREMDLKILSDNVIVNCLFET